MKILISKHDLNILDAKLNYLVNEEHTFSGSELKGRIGEKIAVQRMYLMGYRVLSVSSKRKGNQSILDITFINDEGDIQSQEIKIDAYTQRELETVLPGFGKIKKDAWDSGNMVIETVKNRLMYGTDRKPIKDENGKYIILSTTKAGLFITESDFFITIMFGAVFEFWIGVPEKLKNMINDLDSQGLIEFLEIMGDGKAGGYKLKRDLIRDYFEIEPFTIEIVEQYPEEIQNIYNQFDLMREESEIELTNL
jgi:hypothetical protein